MAPRAKKSSAVPAVEAAVPVRAAGRRRPRAAARIPLPYKLVLNQWMLSLFRVDRFEKLAEFLRSEALEGLDENNIHHFHHALTSQLFNLTHLPTDLLLEYDQNIVRHTRVLNEQRLRRGEPPVVWKYFQYLTLLFTEIYLDWYFTKPADLLGALNAAIESYNAEKPEEDRVSPLDAASDPRTQLNKLAFWMATGSGKTLIMHANILQYRHHLEKAGRAGTHNRTLLLTPNEGLSQQHLREFGLSGISAEIFQKDGRGLFAGHSVEILEVTRLKDEMGEKTVAIDAFEGNNLVLVDEGHRGTSSGDEGAWMKARNALCEKGFSFEYSATFGQAVKDNRSLIDTYARGILVDYSYRYFYRDGFGKEYQILNLDEETEKSHRELYMTASLLSFYQQMRYYREFTSALHPFHIEKPLWIFVGGSVTKTLATRDASDIVEILKFIAGYVANRRDSIRRIESIVTHGLVTEGSRNLFAGRFAYLHASGMTPTQIFDDTLALIFNAPGGGRLYVENLKGVTGEISLRVGLDNDAFGVINVGDDAKLVALCEEAELETGEREFQGSLFHAINAPHSTVNLLIGSKKFTEGWSSWRVSTMGLMNVGKGEGAQIIQLFGRGVRLKGYGDPWSLKRSGRAPIPSGIERPRHIGILETLGIFGIHADYMARFREYLEEEGLPPNEDQSEILLPVIRNLGTRKLKVIRLKKKIGGVSTKFGDAFRKLGPVPTLTLVAPESDPEMAFLRRHPVELNWYPKIRAMKAAGLTGGDAEVTLNRAHLTARHIAFLDLEQIYFELERYKAERGWYNLNLVRDAFAPILLDQSWYTILVPAEDLAHDSFEKVRLWQEIAESLLKKYVERYYSFRKQAWELPHLEYRDLTPDDPNMLPGEDDPNESWYRVLVDESQEEIVAKLKELEAAIRARKLKSWEFQGLKAIWFGQHLYEPLLFLDSKIVEIIPTPLNEGERRFVEDLKAFHDNNGKFFEKRELYLLRNLSRGRGVGFFEAGNFHPDFILWLVAEGRQQIVFVDPKGIRNLGATDPKIEFHRTIKEIEARLADPGVLLHSYIVSNTPSWTMSSQWGMEKAAMRERHILFQEEDAESYIRDMLEEVADVKRPKLRLVTDSAQIRREKFKTLLPLYGLRAACGKFGPDEVDADPEAWVEASSVGALNEQMFVVRAIGRSMEPRIHDGDLVVFQRYSVDGASGSRQGEIVLAQYRGPQDPETGGNYTIKRYSSEKTADETGEVWRHTRITLSPLNQEYEVIELAPMDADAVAVIGIMLGLI